MQDFIRYQVLCGHFADSDKIQTSANTLDLTESKRVGKIFSFKILLLARELLVGKKSGSRRILDHFSFKFLLDIAPSNFHMNNYLHIKSREEISIQLLRDPKTYLLSIAFWIGDSDRLLFNSFISG